MLEGSEAVAAALDLLDAQVEAFGRAVGRAGDVVGEDLVPPRARGCGRGCGSRRPRRRGSRRWPCRSAARRRPGRRPGRCRGRTLWPATRRGPRRWGHRRAGRAASGRGPARRAVRRRSATACGSDTAGRACGRGAERLVLHPTPDLVQAAVGDPHDMERVRDPAGVIEVRRQPGPERLGQIGGHHLDARQPVRIGVRGPSAQVSGPLPSTMSIITWRSRSTRPVAYIVECCRFALGSRLVDTELADRDRPGRGHRPAGAVLDHRVHHRPPTHPELLGDLDTGRASSPTWRHASTPARRVSTTCASTCSRASRSRSSRHSAFTAPPPALAHTNRAGRPKHARSRTATGTRSCASARHHSLRSPRSRRSSRS